MDTNGWVALERPGYFGRYRNDRYRNWDEKYGAGNWRIVWLAGESYVDFLGVCALYEDAYFVFLKSDILVLKNLIDSAIEVYDDAPSNVESGLDYKKQETERTHIQDIAIRRSLIRMGRWFKGTELIRIRQEKGTHKLSVTLSPGRVRFHLPELIVKPQITGWWDNNSIESFYQSNKHLQIKS